MSASELFDELSVGLFVNKNAVSQRFPDIDACTDSEFFKSFSEVCVFKSFIHPDWGVLAGRAEIRKLWSETPEKFSQMAKGMKSVLDEKFYEFVASHSQELDNICSHERDNRFDWMAINTLEKSYLLKKKCFDGKLRVFERPQHMYLRVATQLWMPDVQKIKEFYDGLSLGFYTVASPIFFNAGLKKFSGSSCFLGKIPDDLIGIIDTWKQMAIISSRSGGVGYSASSVRHSDIGGGLGESSGVVSLLRVPDAVLGYVDQGGRRKGSGTFFLACWHIDIFTFVDAKKPGGDDLKKARQLFYAIWTSDLFMKRVETDGNWSLFCPKEAPGLDEIYGKDFEDLYERYEKEGRARTTVKAQELWHHILVAQAEVGMPFIVYKDAICRKNNQKHTGIPHSLNLCVAGNTRILTKEKGHVEIESVMGQELHVWNGEEWSLTKIIRTATNQDLLKVEFSNGATLECTPQHRFFVEREHKILEVRTVNLKEGDCLEGWKVPENPKIFEEGVRVVSVSEGRKNMDTFCFKEEKRGRGMFEGIVTGQCLEITENTSDEEIASCNLSSVCLNSFVDKESKKYDFGALASSVRFIVRSLNNVIDRNYYPSELPSIKTTNLRHRPLGIGVQGLADTFAMMDICWGDEEARNLNRKIFETMYHAAVTESRKISKERASLGFQTPYYETFPGSPLSKGFFAHDLWDAEALHKESGIPFDSITVEQVKSYRKKKGIPESFCGFDWDKERLETMRDGVYNSLLIALMPTASTAQILRNNESFEAFTSIIGKRTVLSGAFAVVNRHFIDDMIGLGVWNKKNMLICLKGQGSVQGITTDDITKFERLEHIKRKYLNAFELSQKRLCQLGIDRSRYVCQSSSHNCFMRNPTYQKLTSYHFFQWENGAKTGMYYLRTSAPGVAVSVAAEAECLMCSS
ncbi:ribonucleoside diphosphate reductase alpha subunit [Cannes 8 virus]|nr:ribonucleoside diphosphate reductase alpha subunit [Cannes 8 virus]